MTDHMVGVSVTLVVPLGTPDTFWICLLLFSFCFELELDVLSAMHSDSSSPEPSHSLW